VWSFTTNAATVPATPILATPANGATGEPTSLTLTWNAAARATSYTVEVGAAANFATTVFMQSGLTALLSPVSGLAIGTTYYWRVNASNAIGTGAWSTVRNFTTSATPAAPTPIYPAAGSTGEPSTVTLTWNTVAGAATYMLQTSTNNLFATTVSSIAGITGDSLTLSGLSNNSTYFWRVEAVNGLAVSAWSATSWFTVSYSGTLTESHAVIAMPTFGIRNGVISYSLQKSGPVELAVFDLRGRSVFGLNHTQSAGNYAIDLANRSVAPGRYFVWFKAGAFEQRTAMAYYGKR
jgi:hypothetical protein